MATYNLGVIPSVEAAADLSTNQFHFGIFSAGQLALCGAGAAADGVIQNKPASGQAAALALAGSFSKIKLGATVAADAEVMSDATGRAITATSGNRILGKLKEGGAVNEIVTLHHYIGPIAP